MVKQPLLSIIFTSYTTERINDIYELLDSIKTQSYSNVETIFVAEQTKELLNKVNLYAVTRNTPNLKVLFNDGEMGLSAARNVGIKEAKGDIIAFVDDDVVLFPEWAEELVRAYDDGNIIGVTGPALPLWEDKSMAWFPKEFYWIISCTAWCNWSEVTEVRNAWGMNMSFRAEAFQECGLFSNEYGFHKGPMAEDNEFSLRVKAKTGKRIVYCPSVRLWHRVHEYRLSQRFIRERAYWIGRSRRTLKRFHSGAEKDGNLLDQESQLLNRIMSRFLPRVIKDFPAHPVLAWRRLSLATTALFFITLGYYSHLLPPLKQPPVAKNACIPKGDN